MFRRSERGLLSVKAILATGLFALVAMAVTSLAIRQLAVTRQAGGQLENSAVVDSTFNQLQGDPDLAVGVSHLEPVQVEERQFSRRVEVTAGESGHYWDVTLEMEEVGSDPPRKQSYQTRFFKLTDSESEATE